MKVLEDLLLDELAELNYAEREIVKALPKLAKAAACKHLRAAFEDHLKQSEKQVDRLEKIFKLLGRSPENSDSGPIDQLIKQGDALTGSHSDPAVLNAALIVAAQKVEHYEIATYGSARSHAKMLGYGKIATLLEETLREEEETDLLLTELAVDINKQASRAPFASARSLPRGGEPDSGWGFGALLAGVLIGAAVAFLYAPKKGEEIRSNLRDTADQWRDKAESLLEKGRQTIDEQRSRLSRV